MTVIFVQGVLRPSRASLLSVTSHPHHSLLIDCWLQATRCSTWIARPSASRASSPSIWCVVVLFVLPALSFARAVISWCSFAQQSFGYWIWLSLFHGEPYCLVDLLVLGRNLLLLCLAHRKLACFEFFHVGGVLFFVAPEFVALPQCSFKLSSIFCLSRRALRRLLLYFVLNCALLLCCAGEGDQLVGGLFARMRRLPGQLRVCSFCLGLIWSFLIVVFVFCRRYTYQTKDEYRKMYDHTLYDQMRKVRSCVFVCDSHGVFVC